MRFGVHHQNQYSGRIEATVGEKVENCKKIINERKLCACYVLVPKMMIKRQ